MVNCLIEGFADYFIQGCPTEQVSPKISMTIPYKKREFLSTNSETYYSSVYFFGELSYHSLFLFTINNMQDFSLKITNENINPFLTSNSVVGDYYSSITDSLKNSDYKGMNKLILISENNYSSEISSSRILIKALSSIFYDRILLGIVNLKEEPEIYNKFFGSIVDKTTPSKMVLYITHDKTGKELKQAVHKEIDFLKFRDSSDSLTGKIEAIKTELSYLALVERKYIIDEKIENNEVITSYKFKGLNYMNSQEEISYFLSLFSSKFYFYILVGYTSQENYGLPDYLQSFVSSSSGLVIFLFFDCEVAEINSVVISIMNKTCNPESINKVDLYFASPNTSTNTTIDFLLQRFVYFSYDSEASLVNHLITNTALNETIIRSITEENSIELINQSKSSEKSAAIYFKETEQEEVSFYLFLI